MDKPKTKRTIRARIIILILVVVVPLSLFQIYTASQTMERRTFDAYRLLDRSTQEAQVKIDDLISASEELLSGLAVTDAVLGRNVFSCMRVLRQVQAKFTKYTNFSVVNADKYIVCSSGTLVQPKFVGKSPNIVEAFETRSFAVSPFKFGVLTGKPVLVFSMPLFAGDGSVAGTVNNGLSLTWLGDYFATLVSTTGQEMLLVNGEGTVMASYPQGRFEVGVSIASTPLGHALMGENEEGRHFTNAEGEDFMISTERVSGVPGDAKVVALAPLAPLAVQVRKELAWQLALIFGLAGISLVGGWIGAQALVIKPIRRLTDLAHKVEMGDFSVRSNQNYEDGELGRLARAYDQMVAGLQTHTKALQISEAHYRELVENDEQLIHRFWPDTTEVFVNQALADFFGGTPDSWVGKRWKDYINPDEVTNVERFLSSRTPQDPNYVFEHMVKNQKGEERWLRWNNQAFFDDEGKITHFQAVGLDLTDRKAVERSLELAMMEARAANMAKSNFMANMSHELRTPLNSIIGFSEMMSSGVIAKLPDQLSEYTQFIAQSGHHLLNIINDILDLSKIEAGMLTLDDGPVNVRKEVEEVMDMVRSQVTAGDNALIEEFDETGSYILLGDRLRIKQVLLNLLGNAAKFTQSGEVTLQGCVVDGSIVIRVKDTGIGMSQEDIKTALSPFGQVDGQHLSKRYEGTGLGLPLAEQLMELHGGKLEIDSQLGEGTTVSMVFPAERTLAGQVTANEAEMLGV
ncbi:ATP-binding protein [Magnetovibrio sp. PR-2]|uniref:ATP-binding protein n=1 Tax=Magnetovibrio sp. PR-2 TaxID=3120356 RepID=UPI002FCE6005